MGGNKEMFYLGEFASWEVEFLLSKDTKDIKKKYLQ